MDRLLFTLGDFAVTVEVALYAGAAVALGLLGMLVVMQVRAAGERREELADEQQKSTELEKQLASVMQAQLEMTGRMQTMAEIFGSRTSDLARLVNERLDAQGQRVGQVLQETRAKTDESLGKLNERLAVIDRAQVKMTELGGEIVSLQAILSNKQTRGAFGQGRMEAIIGDGLGGSGYAFQPTLSNGFRPDCVIHMPNGGPKLVIDAKFPLESWQRIADGGGPSEARLPVQQFKQDMSVHIKAISDKYFIPGETQDTAFLFVPSESIFADIHEHYDDIVQKAARARIVIVSPSLLLLSVQVIQALLRDVRMREQAHLIQREVRELMTDIGRLDERVNKLQSHFVQTGKDIGDILTSTGKITRRGVRIDEMDFSDEEPRRLAGE